MAVAHDTELALYLKEINRTPVLSHEEQMELAVKAKKGDMNARKRLVNANLRFVINIAKTYQNHGIEFLDLISEGNVGLLTAVDKFDPKKGNHFITYAVWWIRQAILKAICEKSRAIRLPMNRVNELVKIEKAKKSLERFDEKSEEQEIKEIALMLDMETSLVRELLMISKEMTSLDATVGKTDDDSFGALIADTSNETPEEEAMNSEMKKELESVLDTLKPNEAKVIRLRYGLADGEQKSLKEVGEICNLTKERIRQIEKKAIATLQKPEKINRLSVFAA